jgi:hypothetical protein
MLSPEDKVVLPKRMRMSKKPDRMPVFNAPFTVSTISPGCE